MKPGNHILPKKGVYCVNVKYKDQFYKGIANFGERPTVKGVNLLLETHIFEFNRDIYSNFNFQIINSKTCNNQKIEEYLIDLGHNPANIEWMLTRNKKVIT